LLRNGSLTNESILLWDEPEASLNPKWMVKVAKVLQQLARLGMQIFIATHDFLLSYELSLLNEYPNAMPVELRFFSLQKPAGKQGVMVESGKTLNEIKYNPIVEAFAAHYDREADLFYATDSATF
jgi:ABC-type cobalamin/Fe3+-siderophores transport system ATPase subunit